VLSSVVIGLPPFWLDLHALYIKREERWQANDIEVLSRWHSRVVKQPPGSSIAFASLLLA
jgi:hypothetical protein